MENIIKILKAHRLRKKLNQSEFGKKLGLPQSHISKIEQGASDPRLSTITNMARVLDQDLMLIPKELVPDIHKLLRYKQEHKYHSQIDEAKTEGS